MKKMFQFLMPLLVAWGGANAQTYHFPCPSPAATTLDIREVYVGFELEVNNNSLGVKLDLCDNAVLHREVMFHFQDHSGLASVGIDPMLILFGDGTVETLPATGIVYHTYPANNGTLPVDFQIAIWARKTGTTVYSGSNHETLSLNPSNPVNGSDFVPPSLIHHVSVPKTMPPPVANAFPGGASNVYNGNTIGGADAYIQYAPSHNGKLLKPLIFVDGIDFDEKDYTYNGHVVRHGSTGWDVFQMGNDGSELNDLDSDNDKANPTYRNYPEALSDLGNADNQYDIVFVDFERGSDWIEKNGEVLIELINWVNAEKHKNRQLGLCTEENVVVGASMGGQVAKWALSTMEHRGLAHESHTYVSFDSPQRGANIPLSIQAFALLANRAGLDKSGMWGRLNNPAARQMLIQHLGGELEKGTISMNFAGTPSDCGDPVAMPINMEFTQTAAIRSGFEAEMQSLGYPGKCRNVGVAMGSMDGVPLSFTNGAPLLDGTVRMINIPFTCGGSGDEFVIEAELFADNGGTGTTRTIKSLCDDNGTLTKCNTVGGQASTIFKGALPTGFQNLPLFPRFMTVRSDGSLLNLDNAPGCTRGDLTGLGKLILDADNPLTQVLKSHVNALEQHTTFMPTISILDIQVPMNNAELLNAVNLDNYPSQGKTPFKAIFALKENLRHIELDNDKKILGFSLSQMKIGHDDAVLHIQQAMAINSGQTFNYGHGQNWAPTTNIYGGGKMAINLAGKANFQTPADPTADFDRFDVYIGYPCTNGNIITVKSGGSLQIGNPTGANKRGYLHATEDSKVVIEAGGTLRISRESELVIYENATLELGDGVTVILDDPDSKIVIKGKLQVDGAITFSGQGCFQFENPNAIVFGNKGNGQPNNLFKLHGQAQANKFIRIMPSVGLNIPSGGNLDLEKGTVEQNGAIELTGGSTALLKYVDLGGSGTAIDGINAGQIRLQFCNVRNCFECIYAENGSGTTFIMDSHFDHYGINAVNVINKPALKVYRSTFDGTAGSGHGIFHAISADGVPLVQLYDSEISNHSSLPLATGPLAWNTLATNGAAAVWLNDVSDCIMSGGFIDYCDIGVANFDGTAPSELFMYRCATIKRCTWGVMMNGNATNGMVTMDGAKIVDTNRPITGTDLLLNIEPTCGRNNSFVSGYIPGAVQPYFNICYMLKNPPSPISMRYNHWAHWASSWVVQDPNPDSHMALTKGLSCSTAVAVIASSPVSEERFKCSGDHGCWEALSNVGYNEACTVAVSPATVEGQFNQAYAAYLNEDYPTAFALFQPLSDMAGSGTSAYTTWCKQYVDISRAMVDPNASYHSKGDAESEGKTSFLHPNPATESVEIGLAEGESLVTVTDVFGKKVWENNCNGSCFLSVADWAPGMYTVQVFPVGAVRPIVEKLMVIKP